MPTQWVPPTADRHGAGHLMQPELTPLLPGPALGCANLRSLFPGWRAGRPRPRPKTQVLPGSLWGTPTSAAPGPGQGHASWCTGAAGARGPPCSARLLSQSARRRAPAEWLSPLLSLQLHVHGTVGPKPTANQDSESHPSATAREMGKILVMGQKGLTQGDCLEEAAYVGHLTEQGWRLRDPEAGGLRGIRRGGRCSAGPGAGSMSPRGHCGESSPERGARNPKLLRGTQRQEPRAPLPRNFTRKTRATRQAPPARTSAKNPPASPPCSC